MFSLGLQGTPSVRGLLHHLAGATPVTHGPVNTTTTTVSTPGYAAPPHLVYTQHVTTVTPSAVVQALIDGFARRVVTPPPGFTALASAPDFRCPKSLPLDLPPVPRMSLAAVLPPAVPAVPAAPGPSPADVVPARGVAAPVAGPSGQLDEDDTAVNPESVPGYNYDTGPVKNPPTGTRGRKRRSQMTERLLPNPQQQCEGRR
ncbi:uncharacterized protein LOC135198852 [Macrobrachium nipponense]|uniref:uncharacterized protein LOC135198852 n=1 Tax=Macrobrachium nipponense TaxID=159736 RepID=UPI0030C7FA33